MTDAVRWSRVAVWGLAAAAAAVGLASMLATVAADQPGDYVEGVVLAAQADLRAGRPLYDHRAWSAPPYRINLYGPVGYRLGAWAAAAVGAPAAALAPGRLMSLAALALVLAALWRLGRRHLGLPPPAAALGLLVPLGMLPVVVFGAQNRVDLLAIAFAAWGLVAAAEVGRGRWLAAPLFVVAVFVKPTVIAAVAAVGLWWLLGRRWKELGVTVLACLVLGGLWLGALAVATDGDFLRAVFGFNALPFSVGGWLAAVRQALSGGLLPVAAGLGLALAWAGVGGERLAGLWLTTSVGLALATVGRVGANVNYFVEPCLVAGPVLALVFERTRGTAAAAPWLRLGAPLLAASVLAASALETGARVVAEARGRAARPQVEVALEGRLAPGDAILTMEIASAMRLGATPWNNDPFIFSRLAELGLWDERPMLDDLAAGRVRWVLADEDLAGPRPAHTNWTDGLRRVVGEHFAEAEVLGRLHLYRYAGAGGAP